MKVDYTKTLLFLILVCLVVLCVMHTKMASAAQEAVALNKDELERRREQDKALEKAQERVLALEKALAKALMPEERSAPLGFTAMPFATD